MSDFLRLARRLSPILLAVGGGPYWVSVAHPPGRPGLPPSEPVLEFYAGPGFEYWYPDEDCMAIFAVMTATALTGRPPPKRSRRQRARGKCLVLCAVSREGEAYCALAPAGGRTVEGTPQSGHVFDFLRSKFGLPPGPPCPYDLAASVELD